MNQTQSILCVCGLVCVYPLIAAVLGITLYKRYETGGWKYMLFGNPKQ